MGDDVSQYGDDQSLCAFLVHKIIDVPIMGQNDDQFKWWKISPEFFKEWSWHDQPYYAFLGHIKALDQTIDFFPRIFLGS